MHKRSSRALVVCHLVNLIGLVSGAIETLPSFSRKLRIFNINGFYPKVPHLTGLKSEDRFLSSGEE